MAPTKVAPGHLVLEVEILKLKPREELWLLSGELDLCPQYPRDYVVYLGKSHFPQGDPYALERGIFLLAQKMAMLIKQTQFPSYRLELEKKINQKKRRSVQDLPKGFWGSIYHPLWLLLNQEGS